MQLSLVIVTATALFWGRALGEELLLLASQVRSYRWWPWILAHLMAFALTALLLIGFFDQARPLDPLSGVALALAAVAGLASLLFWCLAVMPRPLWVAFWRQGWKRLSWLRDSASGLACGLVHGSVVETAEPGDVMGCLRSAETDRVGSNLRPSQRFDWHPIVPGHY